MKKSTMTSIMTAVIVTGMLAGGWAQAGVIVTDYSDFSETIVSGSGMTYTSTGSDLEIGRPDTDSQDESVYASDEFPKYDSAGMRVSVDLKDLTDLYNASYQSIALAVGNTEAWPGNDANTFEWKLLTDGRMTAKAYDGDGNKGQDIVDPGYNAADKLPDTLFIEKTSSGWTFGDIDGGTETEWITNASSLGGVNITTDGSAIGLRTLMKADGSVNTYTVSDLTVVPEPSSLALLGLAGLLLMKRRRV